MKYISRKTDRDQSQVSRLCSDLTKQQNDSVKELVQLKLQLCEYERQADKQAIDSIMRQIVAYHRRRVARNDQFLQKIGSFTT